MKSKKIFTNSIIKWHKKENLREMPWKGEKDPYKIWLSEIILQQTRVEQGLNYYLTFIDKYPTIEHLALAADIDVFKIWEGLGYYNRCRNLLATARYIAFEKNGIFPNKHYEILLLKGVGPYTAAAIASFAFNLPHAVVDGNVSRVLARYFNINLPVDSTAGKKYFALLAEQLLEKKTPALYNQAIMDFGATICKPKLPLCNNCLLNKNCEAYEKKIVTSLPVKQKKLPVKQRYINFVIATYNNKVYVKQRLEKDIWQNLWQFITIELTATVTDLSYLNEPAFKNLIGSPFEVTKVSALQNQKLTHQFIQGQFIHITLSKSLKSNEYSLISNKNLATLAFPRFITAYLETCDKSFS